MEQNGTFAATITMKDGTEQTVEVKRGDMEDWLTEHGKAKYICPDDNELFERYKHLYERDYNKTHPKPAGQHGGARPNAGRKGKAGGSFHHGFRFSAKVHDILLSHREDMTGFVESAIIAYERAYYPKRGDD